MTRWDSTLRADREAVEYYVWNVLTGMRAVYVDPRSLPLGEVANMIPAVAPRVHVVRVESESLPRIGRRKG